MLRIDIISVLPEMMDSFLQHSILKRAQDKKIIEIVTHPLRVYGEGTQKQVDDYAYGGDAGMVIMPDPLSKAIEALLAERAYDEIIFMCPDGEPLRQKTINRLSLVQNLMIICGRYKGIDERIRELYITREICIGDYVISGGELAACVLVDAITRVLPGAISDGTSALTDSFQDGLLSPPVYTRPRVFQGKEVPAVLLSGNHHLIETWKQEQSLMRTTTRRPDLL